MKLHAPPFECTWLKRLFQYGKGDECILSVGEITGSVREEIFLIKVDIDSTAIEHEDERHLKSGVI